ncbi:MAG TPA: hypothetical protein VGN17_13095 [Bryobacteraceae bacterium]|jgi:hypothetical protein
MNLGQAPTSIKYTVEAPSPRDSSRVVKLGVRIETISLYTGREWFSKIAQLLCIVRHGLGDTKHVFQGLKRPLMHDSDALGDQKVFVYSWKPRNNAVWVGGRDNGELMEHAAPPGQVFTVLVREQDVLGVSGTIENWAWIFEDPSVPNAPMECKSRFDKSVWSRA